MRSIAAAALLLSACGGSSDDGLEARARATLERDGWSEVAIARAEGEGPNAFDFTGVREGHRCEGTIYVHVRDGRTTSSMQSRCE